MRNLSVCFLMAIATTLFSQTEKPADWHVFRTRITVGAGLNFDREHYRTTIDWGGVQSVVNGTVNNIINQSSGIIDQTGAVIGSIFGTNKPKDPKVTTNPDGSTRYDYGDKILTQKRIVERIFAPTLGVEFSMIPWKRYVDAGVGVKTGKYRYFALDVSGYARTYPYTIFGELRRRTTGYSFNEKSLLNNLFLGIKVGHDGSYPGFLIITDKTYHGITTGISFRFWEQAEFNWCVFFDTKKRGKSDINQSNMSLNVNFPLSKNK